MTAQAARALYTLADIRRIESLYISSSVPSLMERAGAAAAQNALSILGQRDGNVLVLAGPGNNGGDGFVLARHLRAAGRGVVVAHDSHHGALPPDAAEALRKWIGAGGTVVSDFDAQRWALIADAMLGIGNTRPLAGKLAQWAQRINTLSCPVLALDVPTGLHADSGKVIGELAIRATHTSTFIGLKPGLLTADGPDYCGKIECHDLGLPAHPGSGYVVSTSDFAEQLRPRLANSHKGSYGEAAVVGGAPGMVGAALLAGRAALYLGAGRVYLGLLAEDAPRVDFVQPELMIRTAAQAMHVASALAIGPGLGQSASAEDALQAALLFSGALVIDADGINLLAQQDALQTSLAARQMPTILTPHPAEAGRLLKCSSRDVQADRIACARQLARRYKAYVILKGNGSVVATPDERWFINTNGNPGLATAGTGDVLTGFILALLAQAWPAEKAVLGAVHLHGAAADRLAAEGIGPVGMTASELPPAARALLNTWIKARTQR